MAPKRKTAKNSGRAIPWHWILILVLFIGELFFYTWCRVQCVQVGIAISEQRSKQKELVTLQNSLKIELARLKSPEMIMRAANHKLGLAMPAPKQTIVLP
jgi:cell division protein FtsL